LNLRPSGYEPIPNQYKYLILFKYLRDKALISQRFQPHIQHHSRVFAGKTERKRAFAG
jgi:hypothetical protein